MIFLHLLRRRMHFFQTRVFPRQGLVSTLKGFLNRTSYIKSLKQKHIPQSFNCGMRMVDALRTQYSLGEPRRGCSESKFSQKVW
ncbi:LOW QUALITY PROTEIN: hypothetical protein GLYMA_07G215800v4 [Glycine max]|uniref:Uncharacterized protein n=1 Tax=Glycine max TaxID=3847 RepID=K7L334_SOYBN|nr:LOW QUALITY PROTEIN: hypothetical protein GLYMA_07G215800v4 [Glycine max]